MVHTVRGASGQAALRLWYAHTQELVPIARTEAPGRTCQHRASRGAARRAASASMSSARAPG
eukprot:scaffold38418_cov47-Phaeocystis_antarctica.AAC.3